MALAGSGMFTYDMSAGWSLLETTAVAVDSSDNVYVFNHGEHPVIVFDSDGNFLRVLLMNVPYPADYQPPYTAINPNRRLPDATQPWSMCITDSTPQEIWVSDNEPGRIYQMTLDGEIKGWLGSSGRGPGQFNWVHGLDCSQMDEGILWVADMNNWRVQKLFIQSRRITSDGS